LAPAGIQEQTESKKEEFMLIKSTFIPMVAVLAAMTAPAIAQPQQLALPNLAGTYKCAPQPDSCKWPGESLSITQSGAKLELKNGPSEFAAAKLTSAKTLSAGPPWNVEGLILPDHSIEWSNGTKGRKQ
jgi:hypothetical protein